MGEHLSFFFFSSRRRHTRSKRDWSSDVCSSDLRITTLPCSPGRKTSAAPGPASQIVTANVSDGCGDFTCSVARAHFGRAVCRCFRFFFRKKISQRQARRSESVLQRTRTRKKQNSPPHFALRSNRF